jgi:hypothetical protein
MTITRSATSFTLFHDTAAAIAFGVSDARCLGKRLPTDSGARPGLLGQLSEVLAEQESRQRIANASVSRKSARGL